MYEKYLQQLETAGNIRNLKQRSITCYTNYVTYFLNHVNKNPVELTLEDVRAFLLAKKDSHPGLRHKYPPAPGSSGRPPACSAVF